MSQLQQNNIFKRTRDGLKNSDSRFQANSRRFEFESCKLTIQSIVDIVDSQPPYTIEQASLEDFAYALVDINKFFLASRNSPDGPSYPFSKLIGPLNKAAQYVGVAVGQRDNHPQKRTDNIQKLSEALRALLEQIEGFGEPP